MAWFTHEAVLSAGDRRHYVMVSPETLKAASRERRVSAVITAITNRRVTAAVTADVARLSRLLGKR